MDLDRQLRLAVFPARPQPPAPNRTGRCRTSTNTRPQTHNCKHNHKHKHSTQRHIYSTQPQRTIAGHNHNTRPQSQRATRGPTNKVENRKTHDHGSQRTATSHSKCVHHTARMASLNICFLKAIWLEKCLVCFCSQSSFRGGSYGCCGHGPSSGHKFHWGRGSRAQRCCSRLAL